MWAVADGLGGHSDGEVASRMVCDALADFRARRELRADDRAARAGRVQEVNEHLDRGRRRASTTPFAAAARSSCCCRAGRAARFSGLATAASIDCASGRLEQLTRDHSLAESGRASEAGRRTAITRAVGGEPTLTLDLYRDRVRAGDRFLLCSDGLTRAVPEAQIGSGWNTRHPRRRRRPDQGDARGRGAGQRDGV